MKIVEWVAICAWPVVGLGIGCLAAVIVFRINNGYWKWKP